jgi:hypothetical protein
MKRESEKEIQSERETQRARDGEKEKRESE